MERVGFRQDLLNGIPERSTRKRQMPMHKKNLGSDPKRPAVTMITGSLHGYHPSSGLVGDEHKLHACQIQYWEQEECVGRCGCRGGNVRSKVSACVVDKSVLD